MTYNPPIKADRLFPEHTFCRVAALISALAATILVFAVMAAPAHAGALWEEDWTQHNPDSWTLSHQQNPNAPSGNWNLHTYNPNIGGSGSSYDSFSWGNAGGDEYLQMQGVSWGIESKQAFNKDTPIDVETQVNTRPDPSRPQTTTCFGGVTIYDGESGYEEIALQDDGNGGGLRAVAMWDAGGPAHDQSKTLPSVGGFTNQNLPEKDSQGNPVFYDLRLVYDGQGNTQYWVNGNLLWTNSTLPLDSNPDIFLLSVELNDPNAWNTPNDTPYGVLTDFKTVKVNGYYNLFSNTTHVNLMDQPVLWNVNADPAFGQNCGTYNQCDYLQLSTDQFIRMDFDQSGYTLSPVIDITNYTGKYPGIKWGEVLTTAALNGQDLYVQVFQPGVGLVPDSDLPGNSRGFRGNSIVLSGLDPNKYPQLQLMAAFRSLCYPCRKSPMLLDWTLTFGTRSFFTWYDQQSPGMKDWLLAADPSEFGGEAHFWAQLGNPPLAAAYLDSRHGKSAFTTWPGRMGGPLTVNKLSGLPAVISQRVLFGNSLEETPAIDESKLSSQYYWTWYDEFSPGFKNWVLVGNPSTTDAVTTQVSFFDVVSKTQITGTYNLAPGQRVTPDFPGRMGGPVLVNAWKQGSPGTPEHVIASQRVTTGGGTAFNEVGGIPAGSYSELSSQYYWTWYDMQSAGAKNWVLVANPGASAVYYQISIAGGCQNGDARRCAAGVLAGGREATPTFPGVMGGPVEVQAWSDAVGGSQPASVIASQRSIWGPSFEEVPGYRATALSSSYDWTWYDNLSPGSLNWVLLANTENQYVTADVYIGGAFRSSYTLAPKGMPGSMAYPRFPGVMGGLVEVRAHSPGGGTPQNILASQRVLWSGYFNEVQGTVPGL